MDPTISGKFVHPCIRRCSFCKTHTLALTRSLNRVLLETATFDKENCLKNKPHIISYLLESKTRFFPLKFGTLMWELLSTRPCVAKSSLEISAPLRYHAVFSDNSSPMCLDNLLVPSSRVKKAKRENREWEVNWHNLFFGTCQSSNFLKMREVSEAGCFRFQEKKHPTWWTPYIGHLRNSNVKICIWDQI